MKGTEEMKETEAAKKTEEETQETKETEEMKETEEAKETEEIKLHTRARRHLLFRGLEANTKCRNSSSCCQPPCTNSKGNSPMPETTNPKP